MFISAHKVTYFSLFSFLFSISLFFSEAPSLVFCGLINRSAGCDGLRECVYYNNFFALYNVMFVALIEPSRHIAVAASPLYKPPGVN